MDEDLPRRLVPGREQHRRPVDAVEAEDVLREEVPRRPEAEIGAGRVRQRAEVVDRVHLPRRRRPDPGPTGSGSPRLRRAADREVPQAACDEALRLVGAGAGQDEIRPLVVQLEEAILVGGEAEEPVLLLQPLGLDAVVGALAVDELVLGLERLAADAVEAGVDVLVDVAVVVDPLEELLDEALCPSSVVRMK